MLSRRKLVLTCIPLLMICLVAVAFPVEKACAVSGIAVTEYGTGMATPQGICTGSDGALWFTEYAGNRIGRITTSGVITEYSAGLTAGSGPRGIAAGPDGALWFTEAGGNRIGKITTAGVITEYSAGLTASSNPFSIAAGPDGALWFTEFDGNRIGKITTAGVITEYSAGLTASSNPWGITAGLDSALWFTEYSGDKIGKITTAGVITEYSAGLTAGSGSCGIMAGPDGALWFAEIAGSRIGRITTAGVITEYQGLTNSSSPEGICAGPDGALWFTEANGDRIGRITTSGVITEYGTGLTAGSSPEGICAGPDGALWFTERSGNRIGRITTAGVITEYGPAIPGGGRPEGICAGPDSALWFTDLDGHSIGRITTSGVITAYSAGLTAGQDLEGICAGPDGNLWFTEYYPGSRIGKITTAGVITEYSAGLTGSGPYGICAGSDGALWFTELFSDSIGRITTAGVISEYTGLTASSYPRSITVGSDNALWFIEWGGDRIGRITTAGVISEPCTVQTTSYCPEGICAGSDGNLWFTEPGRNRIGKAANQFAITVTQGAHGYITPAGTSGVVTADNGADQAFTITPAAGYHIVDVLADGASQGPTSSYTFADVTADHTISASFALNQYVITTAVDPAAGGTVTGAGTYAYGNTVNLAATPAAGYHFVQWTEGGTAVSTNQAYSFTATAARTLVAHFASDKLLDSIRYLPEGSTNWGFDCYVSIANPNTEAIHAKLTYMTSSGPVTGPTVAMPAKSQATVYPESTLGAADFSTKVECEEGKTISVDRTMYWTGTGAACPEAHCATGVTSPATTWYMPEGSSAWGFECFLLIQNPNGTAANCTVTWMIEGEASQASNVSVPANSRQTLNMADFIGAKDASIKVVSNIPVIPERAMYRNDRREGHDSTGTAQAATDYYLAEGCAGFGFTTYVLVQNPQSTPTDVTITYQAASGPVAGPSFKMPANSRKTINVNDTTVIPGADPSFSTKVHGSQPIIAERAMYWNGGADNAQVCHDSIGLDQPYANWYLADGQSSEGRETWTLVQNPNSTAVTVEVTYMTPNGVGNVVRTETIAAGSRKSFNMAEHSGISGRAAIMVVSKTAGKKVMVERAMYWNDRGTGTDTIGGYSDSN